MSTVIRHSALPFISNLSGLMLPMLYASELHLSHWATSSLVQRRGSTKNEKKEKKIKQHWRVKERATAVAVSLQLFSEIRNEKKSSYVDVSRLISIVEFTFQRSVYTLVTRNKNNGWTNLRDFTKYRENLSRPEYIPLSCPFQKKSLRITKRTPVFSLLSSSGANDCFCEW